MREEDFQQSVDTSRPDQRLDWSIFASPLKWLKHWVNSSFYVDIDPDFIKLSTPMEKSLSPERTYRNYEFVRGIVLIYRRAGLPMRRLEVAPLPWADARGR